MINLDCQPLFWGPVWPKCRCQHFPFCNFVSNPNRGWNPANMSVIHEFQPQCGFLMVSIHFHLQIHAYRFAKKNYPWIVFSTQHLWTAKSRCFAWSSPCSSTAPALHLGAPHGSRRRLSRPCAARGGPAESTCHRRGLGFRASGIQGLGNWGWTAVGGWLLFNHQKNGRFWKRHIKSNTKIVIKCCCHSGMQLGLIFTGIYSITMVTEPAI